MGTRVLMQSGLIRVSKPGQDVYTAAERDLLLSISARSGQVIQRGYETFPNGTNRPANGTVAQFNKNVFFPNQQTVPDVWVSLTGNLRTLSSNTNTFTIGRATYTLSFYTDHFEVSGIWDTADQANTSQIYGFAYAVLRKRLDS